VWVCVCLWSRNRKGERSPCQSKSSYREVGAQCVHELGKQDIRDVWAPAIGTAVVGFLYAGQADLTTIRGCPC